MPRAPVRFEAILPTSGTITVPTTFRRLARRLPTNPEPVRLAVPVRARFERTLTARFETGFELKLAGYARTASETPLLATVMGPAMLVARGSPRSVIEPPPTLRVRDGKAVPNLMSIGVLLAQVIAFSVPMAPPSVSVMGRWATARPRRLRSTERFRVTWVLVAVVPSGP